jgi:hypothetical protein
MNPVAVGKTQLHGGEQLRLSLGRWAYFKKAAVVISIMNDKRAVELNKTE